MYSECNQNLHIILILCLMQTLSSRNQELNRLKSDWSAHTTTLSSEHTATLTAEREKALQTQTDIRSKHEQEKRELEQTQAAKVTREHEKEGIDRGAGMCMEKLDTYTS